MRDLLRVLAEPALAELDKKRSASLRKVVGTSKGRAAVVLLMNGARTQADLCKESGLDQANVSRLLKALRDRQLIKADEKHLELVISIPSNFFEKIGETS